MTQWLLIAYLAADLWVALAAYDSEDACYAALAQYDFAGGWRGTCLPGVIEPQRKPSSRRVH